MINYTEKYDLELKKIVHFVKYPEAIPFIGIDYGKLSPKILIIAESHYVQSSFNYKLLEDDFYDNRKKYEDLKLNFGNINPRAVITKTKDLHRIYSTLDKILPYGLNGAAFINFFQKPAKTKESLTPTEKDIKIANDIFRDIINIIKPDLIIFTSKKALKNLKRIDTDKDLIYCTSHPNSPWWNRKNKMGKSGKDIFLSILSKFNYSK